ncbi:hypothetical protein ABMA27_014129 [Loxostege sticticalis]|uniref:Uncharacterized protein n=1 Tax=Loxostege sticticalis TaxID=481309 RepID=A0ABR3ICV1_LOXSC
MLLGVLLTIFSEVYSGEAVDAKPCSFPIPLEMPNRNDRSDQCWLRIEDVELVETVTVWCYIAHGFLRNYIHDYNSRKMIEDGVDVSLWSEEPRPQDDIVPKPLIDPKGIKDWKLTTVLDPVTHMRLYVTKNADCKIVMYSREGMSNYKVNCERVLYYINERMQGSAVIPRVQFGLICICIFLVFVFK